MAWTDDDESLLAQELNEGDDYVYGEWRRRGFFRRLPGGRVMTIWSALLWLVMIGFTTSAFNGAKDLGAVGVLVLMGIEGFVAIWLSQLLWKAIGPRPRQMFRFTARYWYAVIPLLCCVVGRLAAPFLVAHEEERLHALGVTDPQIKAGVIGAVKGSNWEIVLDVNQGYRKALHDEAQSVCASLGEDYRLPQSADLWLLSPPARAPERVDFWLEDLEQQSRRFRLKPFDREREKGHDFSLLMEGNADPEKAGVLCFHGPKSAPPAPTPLPAVPEPVAVVAEAVSSKSVAAAIAKELRCLAEADQAARGADGSQLASGLTCLKEAQAERARLDFQTVPLATLPAKATDDDRVAAMLAFPEDEASRPAILKALASSNQLEAQVAERALFTWSHAHPKEASAASGMLLVNAMALDQAREPGVRAAHALAVGAGVVEACRSLAQRALDGPWPNSPAAEALRHVKGPCAAAAANLLYEQQRESHFAMNFKWVEAVRALGAVASPQVVEGDAVRGLQPFQSGTAVWDELLESELMRRHGLVPPHQKRSLELPGFPSLKLETRLCTPADYGLRPKDRAPVGDDRCVKSINAAPLAPLKDAFLPVRALIPR